MKSTIKDIKLYTDEGFEQSLIEVLQKMAPGPVYVQEADTPFGSGVYICSEPFTLEEADALHEVTDDPEDFDDILGDETLGDLSSELDQE